jgi:hypothetical protein
MRGVEAVSLELFATLSAEDARARAAPLAPELDAGGRGAASLLVFEMRGLSLFGLPGVDYAEALWRVKVRHGAGPAWLAVACDVDRALPRLMAARLVRDPVRAARVSARRGDDGAVTVRVEPGFEARLSATGEHAAGAPLPLLVAPRGPRRAGRPAALARHPRRKCQRFFCLGAVGPAA